MELLPLPLWQEFNKTYTDVVNCDIISPPFYTGRVPQSFFFKKRWAISAVASKETFDEIYDTYESWTDVYYIWKIWTAIKVKKNSTTLYTWTYTAWVAYKFFFSLSAKWTSTESWTAWEWVTVWADIVLQDTTKTWTVNAYAWKYVYVYEAISWEWQIFKIDSNTATDLVITQSWWKIPPTGAKYYIFPDYWFTLSFVDYAYVYTINSDSVVLPIKAIPNPIDALYFNWRYYIVDKNKNVFVWDEWFFAWYFNQASLIGSAPDILNIANHRDLVLLLWANEVNCVQSEKFTLQDTATTTVVKTFFKIVPVTKEIWLFTQNSFTIYNQWFYILSKYKQLLWVSITSVWIDKYFVDTKNQWMYIQKYLDNLATTNAIRLHIDDQKISLIVKETSQTVIYNYDVLYLWWYKWVTQLPINNIKWDKFIWATIYSKAFDAWKDAWNLSYNQSIRTIVWEEWIFTMKRSLLTKFYIWQNTTKWTYVSYTVMAWWNLDKYTKNFIESWYIQDIAWYSIQTDWTLWTSMLWMSTLWESQTLWLDIMADIALIENPTWFFYDIHIIDIKADDSDEIEFWWLAIWYSIFQPQVTPIRNVI